MIKGEHAELTKIAAANVCAADGGELSVVTHEESGQFALRCGQGHLAEAVKRAPTLAQRSKQGDALPATATYHHLPEEDLGTHTRLTAVQVGALINYAHKYGLDPFRGHVQLVHGKPYIGLDGYIYHARMERIPYRLASRPMTPEERTANLLGEHDHGWITELTRLDNQAYAVGVGVVPEAEMLEEAKGKPGQLRSPVVAAHPWQLAQKRAEWQALRRAFPIGEETEPKEDET